MMADRARQGRPVIMWTWQDAQVDHPDLLDDALTDIAANGFGAALAMLRGCRYAVSDRRVIAAAEHAAATAHRLGIEFWFALDPRLDQGRLVGLPGGRAIYLLTCRDANGALPCQTRVDDAGNFTIRLDYATTRSQHMLSQVAFSLDPVGVEHAIVYQRDAQGVVLTDSVRDVTATTQMFVQRADGYLEIFGRTDVPGDGAWHVLAVPRCESTYPELGSDTVVTAVRDMYRDYHTAGVALDGVFWDEFGYVTGYGDDQSRLPWGPAIHEAFAARHGSALTAAAPYLLLDDDAGIAIRVRRDYYAAVQDVVIATQRACHRVAQNLWGPEIDSGIHQTWHQNADDLPHGSADWWRGSAALTGGFTDVGDAERVPDEVLAMTAIAASLARQHSRPRASCNVWGVDFGTAHLDWWAHLLASFGVTWAAHTYGPNGYIDHDTGWGPGYPDHPTWDRFAAANEHAAQVNALVGATTPAADVAVVYPIETLARIGSAAANQPAAEALQVIAGLVRLGVAVNVISPELLATAEVREGALWIVTPRGRLPHRALVYPNPQTLQPAEVNRIGEAQAEGIPVVLIGTEPRETTEGTPLDGIATARLDDLAAAAHDLPRLVNAPPGAIASLFRRPDGCALVVVPDRPERIVDGEIWPDDFRLQVDRLSGVAAIRFDTAGTELKRVVYDGQVRVVAGTLR